MNFSFHTKVSIKRKGNFACVTGSLISATFFAVAIAGLLVSYDNFKSYVYFSSFGVIETVLSIEALALLLYSIRLSKRYKDYSFFIGWILGIFMFFPFFTYLFGILIEGLGKYIGLWDRYEAFLLMLAFIPFFLFFLYSLSELNEHNQIFRL
jgi:hypothetical protein